VFKLGFVTDVHGHLADLDAALVHLRRMGCSAIWCGGDLVAEEGSEAVVSRLRDENIPTVLGNHELWSLASRSGEGQGLSPSSKKWLRALPFAHVAELDGVRVGMIHGDGRGISLGVGKSFGIGSVDVASDWPEQDLSFLLDDLGADVVLVGHTHDAYTRGLDEGLRLVANPGACCRLGESYERRSASRRDLRSEAPDCSLWVPTGRPRRPGFGLLELPGRDFYTYELTDDGQAVRLAAYQGP